MAHSHSHAPVRAASEGPGWSLLRLSAGHRLLLVSGIVALLWTAVLAVIL